MQSLNILNLNDHKLQTIVTKIPERKHLSILNINNILIRLQSVPRTLWSSGRGKSISTIVSLVTGVIRLISVITLYCKCWQNKYSCVLKCTRPYHPPTTGNDINLAPIPETIHSQPQLGVIQEILKYCDMNLAKFEHYKHHKSNHQTTKL